MRPFIDLHSPASPLGWLASGKPQALHRFLLVRSVAAAIAFWGCVPAAQFEEAQSAAEVAQESERRTAQRLAAAEQELERLQEEQTRAKASLAQYDTQILQAAFDRTHLEKQRDEHAELVTQLRGELARVGDHLRVYSDDRQELGERLEAAQEELERLQAQLGELHAAALEEVPSAEAPPAPDDSAGD